ncbi:hypothetical protein CAC42_7876 [Sphaceloma murrayae]|uniref:BTB domain-containing protein n=1 Tax=Sphaceloma murrayae TaxID=2082308 RepID=A0A2K1QY24_9PEZI|nr:hypothetical protein CAC42_7876 [Sphaceloma murrayae]
MEQAIKSAHRVTKRITNTPCPDFTGEVVIVKVGQAATPVVVHEALLLKSSEHMRAVLSYRWMAAPASNVKTATLIDSEVETFNACVRYIYSGYIYTCPPKPQASDLADMTNPPVHRGGEHMEWRTLINLYLLGEYLIDTGFVNAVVDAMIDKWRADRLYPVGYVAQVYNATAKGSPLRKLLVDCHVHLGLGKEIKHGGVDANEGTLEFMIDVNEEWASAGAASWEKDAAEPWDNDPCRYHVHDQKVPKTACQTGI